MISPSMTAMNEHCGNSEKILRAIGNGAETVGFRKKQQVFKQGDTAGPVFYIREGKVRLTVLSRFGQEATLGILSEGDFFGDGSLAGQALRMMSATAISDCELLQIDNNAMMLALHREITLSDLYVAHLLAWNNRYHEALVDQLFGSSEIRLARVLLLLAQFGQEGTPEARIPTVSQEELAVMACTTPGRVRFFLDNFKKSGFVDVSNSGLQIHSSLLNVVLRG